MKLHNKFSTFFATANLKKPHNKSTKYQLNNNTQIKLAYIFASKTYGCRIVDYYFKVFDIAEIVDIFLFNSTKQNLMQKLQKTVDRFIGFVLNRQKKMHDHVVCLFDGFKSECWHIVAFSRFISDLFGNL